MEVFLWKISGLTPGPLITDHRPLTTDHRPQSTDHGPRTTEEKLETADLKEGVKTAKPMDRR